MELGFSTGTSGVQNLALLHGAVLTEGRGMAEMGALGSQGSLPGGGDA